MDSFLINSSLLFPRTGCPSGVTLLHSNVLMGPHYIPNSIFNHQISVLIKIKHETA